MMQRGNPQQRLPQGTQASMQVQQIIYTALTSQTGPLSGWQAQVLINERITLIFNIIGNLRLASQHQRNAPPLQKMVEIGIKFEKDIFERCATKEQYKHEVQVKLEELLERRNQQQANLQQTIQQQAQAQAQAQQAQAQAQQMMMNQNMAGQGMQMPQQPGQQSFAHLQHPMQASPLPGQQPQQNPMGMQNQGLPQNPAQNQQQQFQMAMQQQQQQQQQQNQPQQPQNVPGRPGNQPALSQQDNSLVSDLTSRLLAQTSDEEKNNLRARLRTSMDPASYQKCQAQGMDPIILYFRQQAIGRLRAERNARAQQQQQLHLAQNQNMPTATPMQQQRSMQPSPAQPAATTAGNTDFSSFMGNMENLAVQQQQQGVMAEQSGQIVVPASSGGPRNTTPQPGVMAGQGMNMNDQRGVANPNQRAQQQQQMFNAQQQLQHQRLQHAQAQQQQQSQAQQRLTAQKNAQQMSLQGQPGGMGPGPVPQQSPAMATLNAPMRTPSQQNNHPELPQANPNAQFGQPLDPRFMQGNQRQPGQANGMNAAGLNPAMFASMNQTLPPDKLNEVVSKWNNGANGGARPGMPMQGNPQARPGMPVQQPSMNAQNQAQFAMANPGQRPPPNMMGAMNPQQQMILQQQMAALRPGGQMQRNMPPNVMQMEQRNMLQMDAADIPPIFLNQPGMPQGFPPEIKKWGQMKQWVAQNPNLGPNALEGVKNFQRLHFQQIMQRSRQQHPGGMPPNQVGMPGGMPTGGPGMAAPVAPMGPNMMTPGMSVPQIRQPTPQEIQAIRNHVSGKLANATDDQIRAIFMNNQAKAQAQVQAGQMNPQQQAEQQRRVLALQQMKQMQQQQQQNNGQQPQPAQAPQPNMTSLQNQPKPAPTPQSKPAPAPKPAPSTATPNQAARPQSNARNATQNPSPAQPVKNLKRQNSDDVVEVPNPNTQQQQPAPQQAPNTNNPQARSKPTAQQLAQMNPEMRKRVEAAMRNQMAQNNGQNPIPPMEQMKLKEISKQEELDSQHNLQDIPMDAETKQKMRKMLEGIVGPLQNVYRVVSKWFQLTVDEDQARKFFRARYRLAKQFQDPQMTRPKDTFSIWPQEVEAARALLGNMVKDLTAKYPDLKKPNATKPQAPSQVSQPSQTAQPQAPLNAANLQQQQQQLNKLAHQRSNSRSSNVPAAPTSSQPPFPFGATSPHGAPVYAKNTLDVGDKLHIPPARKKQKQGPAPGQGTPGSNSSPQVAKAVSPEMKRQQQPEMKTQPRPALCCKEPDCERHQIGFENEEDLKKHTQEEHIGPLENPDKFVLENLAPILGLDAQGQSKKSAPAVPEPAPKMATSNSKQGQTPTVKAGNTPSAATPMMRQASMNRQASANGAKPAPSKGTPAKEVVTKAPEQKDVKKENQTPAPLEFNDPWADSMIDPNELFGVFQQFEAGAGGSISDMNVFRGITPNDTPESSKDGVSEPNSDISDGVGLDINIDLFDNSWQPFGPSDTEGLGDLNFAVANDEDLLMFDEEPSLGYQTFDDIDTSMFDKPFSLDTALFSLDSS